jgi:hypothetical protein
MKIKILKSDGALRRIRLEYIRNASFAFITKSNFASHEILIDVRELV